MRARETRSTRRPQKPAGWTCPRCRRLFARAKQSHSCKVQTIDTHFVDKEPSLRELFDFLMGKLERARPFRVDAVKTSINLIGPRQFGGISVRGSFLRLEFLAREPIHSLRIVERQVLGTNRVSHAVLIAREGDIDGELLGWLADAQRLQP